MAVKRLTARNDVFQDSNTGNTILGLAGNDTIYGNGGNDVLDGGLGADSLRGGAGNDTYIVGQVGDRVIELANQGIDLVKSNVTFTLSANVEHLTLTGAAKINGTGSALANTLTGNSGANILDGKAGADKMIGGGGNDTYIVDSVSDRVIESSGKGTDTVKSSVTHKLGANVEHLLLTGSGAIDGTGNGLNNSIKGNAASNDFRGGAGVDTLTGGAGADKFVWAAGETGVGAGNRDIITDFVSGVDKIDLSLIDAATYASTSQIDTAGDQAFLFFLGTGSYWSAAGGPLSLCQVRYDYDSGLNATIVQVNVQTVAPMFLGDYRNQDFVTDYEIQLSGNVALQSTDFIF